MKIVIIGGGPTGMRLADKLSQENNEIILLEKRDKLGGCWRIDWEDNKYFTEHSPRVMSTNYHNTLKLVKELNLEDPYRNVYGDQFSSMVMFVSYTLKNMSILDIMKFLKGMYSVSELDMRTVEEWIDDNNITTTGKKSIKNLAMSLATTTDILSAYIFFKTIYEGFGSGKFIQFKDGDLWIKLWEKKLKRQGVKIYKSREVLSVSSDKKNKITKIKTNKGYLKADNFIFAIPLWYLYEMTKNSSDDLFRNNWLCYEDFIYFSKKSSYSGIGMQLHFKEKQNLSMEWCNTCMTEWSIVNLVVSKYLVEFSKDKKVKEVWSLYLGDFNTKSKRLEKRMGQLSEKELKEEVIYQLEKSLGRKVEPYKITLHCHTDKKGKWVLSDSAYSSTPMGNLKPKGNKIKNIFSVGPHNLYKLNALETALESADIFLKSNFLSSTD